MLDNLCVKILNKSQNPNPEYKSDWAACCDIYSNEDVVLNQFETKVVGTGLYLGIENPNVRFDIFIRSGLASKGLTLNNGVGKIDPDYRGEIKVILTNLSKHPFQISKGDRIAQGEFNPIYRPQWQTVYSEDMLGTTNRGSGGLGSTGN